MSKLFFWKKYGSEIPYLPTVWTYVQNFVVFFSSESSPKLNTQMKFARKKSVKRKEQTEQKMLTFEIDEKGKLQEPIFKLWNINPKSLRRGGGGMNENRELKR